MELHFIFKEDGGNNLKKTGIIITIILLFSIIFPVIPISASSKEVTDFDEIWYHPTKGFNTGHQGPLFLAIEYIDNTARTIDYALLEYIEDPFYFSISFENELEVIRDTEGNIIYRESEDGYIYLSKMVVDNFLSNEPRRLGSKDWKYQTVQYQGNHWYRIYIPDFNRKYEWKKYTEPDSNEKWYTWGSDKSIQFETKAMFIELTFEEPGHLLFDFSHPSDSSGQRVAISKSYLSSKGINNPYFEWGEVIPWKSIPYSENETHYFIEPEHFSTIGIHEASSGVADGGLIIADTYNITGLYTGVHWDTAGDGSANPIGITTNGTFIWTMDEDDRLVYKWNMDGTFIASWEPIPHPYNRGITTYGGYIWTSNANVDGIYKFDMDGTIIVGANFDIGANGSGNCADIATDGTYMWICDGVDGVYVYYINGSWTGTLWTAYGDGLPNNPSGVATNGVYLWFSRDNIVYQYDMDLNYLGCSWSINRNVIGIEGQYLWSASDADDEVYKYNTIPDFNVTRETGAESESDKVYSFSPTINCTGNVTLTVPVSTSVKGIIDVTNKTCGSTATEVDDIDELVNNTFWYDSTNQFVHIGTINLTTSSIVNWTVNCTYGATFAISFPQFLTIGDYIHMQGLIKNASDIPISGMTSKTYVLYGNGSIAAGPVEWNCTNGNFQTTISTTTLPPGIYSISVEFTDSVSGITFKEGETLYLSYSVPEGVGVYSDAVAIFNIYNTNLGLGLPKETLQVYVDGVRKRENIYYTYLGESITVVIKDYYNFTLKTRNTTITEVYTFIDLGLTFHEYDFTNMNDEYFYASFLKSGADRWYEKVVASTGQKNFLLPTGSYTIRVYNADNSSYTSWSDTINSSKAFLIGEAGVTVIIEGQDVVDEPIEWRPPVPKKSFIIPTKPPAYPEDPFTVLEMYDVLQVTSMPKSDAEVTVVFLDTGFSPRTYGGVDLSNIIAHKLPAYASAYDSHGHGTWVSYALASIFESYLPNARLISFKVFDGEGACTKEQLIEAFDAVKKLNPDVVSFSGGAYGGPLDDISKKVNELRSEGIIVVVAAGNMGPASGTVLSPASSKGAICVGAIDPKNTLLDRDDDVVTSWSSRGPVPSVEPKPDFTAPGESIRGPWVGSQATISGTSAATPLVAAGIAIMYGNNKGILDFADMLYFWDGQVVPNILEGAMIDTAYEKGSANDYGWGIPDFDKANDAVYGKALILIIIWFVAIISIIVVAIIAIWYWWPFEWVEEKTINNN